MKTAQSETVMMTVTTTAMVQLLLVFLLSFSLPSLSFGGVIVGGGDGGARRNDAGIIIHPHLFNNHSTISFEEEGFPPISANASVLHGPMTENEFILRGNYSARAEHRELSSQSPDQCPAQDFSWAEFKPPATSPPSIQNETANLRSESGCTETPSSVSIIKAKNPPYVAVMKAETLPDFTVMNVETPLSVAPVKVTFRPIIASMKTEISSSVVRVIPPSAVIEIQPSVAVVAAETSSSVAVMKAPTPSFTDAEVLPCLGQDAEDDNNTSDSSFVGIRLDSCLHASSMRVALQGFEQSSRSNSTLPVEILRITTTFLKRPSSVAVAALLWENEIFTCITGEGYFISQNPSKTWRQPSASASKPAQTTSTASRGEQDSDDDCRRTTAAAAAENSFSYENVGADMDDDFGDEFRDINRNCTRDDDVNYYNDVTRMPVAAGHKVFHNVCFIAGDDRIGDIDLHRKGCSAGNNEHPSRATFGLDHRQSSSLSAVVDLVTKNGSRSETVRGQVLTAGTIQYLRNAMAFAFPIEMADIDTNAIPAEPPQMTSNLDLVRVTFKDDEFETKAQGIYMVVTRPDGLSKEEEEFLRAAVRNGSKHLPEIYVMSSQACRAVTMETSAQHRSPADSATDGSGERLSLRNL